MNKQELQNEIKKTKEHLANMEKMLAECEYERWKPNTDDPFYFVESAGDVFKAYFDESSDYDAGRYNTYNCFQTREQAEIESEKILVRRILEDIARRLNKGRKLDYKNTQSKYYIFWSSELDEIRQKDLYWIKIQGVVYCLDENFLNVAIREIGEERLKKYLRGE